MNKLINVTLFIMFTMSLNKIWAIPSREDLMSSWCGDENCYEVMEVNKNSTKEEIIKNYKKLALKYHPDKNPTKKKTVEKIFQRITYAYTILSDDEMRARYDEVSRIKARLYVPKENPLFVGFLVTMGWATLVYYYGWYSHRIKRKRLLQNEAVRRRVQTKLLKEGKKLRIKNNIPDDDVSDAVIRECVAELKIKVPGGFDDPPSFAKTLKILPLIPLNIAKNVYFHLRWMFLYTFLKRGFSQHDKEHLTMNTLGLTPSDWQHLSPAKRNHYVEQKLWAGKKMR